MNASGGSCGTYSQVYEQNLAFYAPHELRTIAPLQRAASQHASHLRDFPAEWG